MLNVGIIGAGLIGKKRGQALSDARVVAVADKDVSRATSLAEVHGAAVETSWENLVGRGDVDLVLVATTNDALVPCALGALAAGKHVLMEKPAGRTANEIAQLKSAAGKSNKILRVGFNHRFHPAFQKAKSFIDQGAIGPLMYIRARYGHGGRVGYNKEWRADPKLSGGGELLDQGVHLIDLCRWLGGEFDLSWGQAKRFFWDMPVEDNGFIYLESPDKTRSAFLHASCTEWKNLFDFEIFGRTGKLEIWGLGRSYGIEELRVYWMKPEMGPPDTETFTFPGEDSSWEREFAAFAAELNGQKTDLATIDDALKAAEIVSEVYHKSGFPLERR